MKAKENQTTQVYNQIKEKIVNGEYTPSENLVESNLAATYDVSRNTIKKALLMLENDGYVTIETNKGAKVRSYSKKEVLEFLELREVLEGFVVHLSVPYFSKEKIRKMDGILSEMKDRAAADDLLSYSSLNQQFHLLIYDACPNRTAVNVLTKLKHQMSKYNSKTILVPGRKDESLKEHSAIAAAIENGDADLAEHCMRKHIHDVREIFEKYYSILF
jgi:DNA-binding GntR family transcriptional regulator